MEQIKLDLIPGYVPPICHASQYDEGRVIRVNLTEGGNAYTLSTETIELDVRKGDGNIVTSQLTVESGKSYVDIVTTEQMCAVAGSNLCELHVVKGSVEIGSLNFILECEPSPTEGGVRSNTVIDNLQTQINAMVAQALAGYGDIIPTEEVEKTPVANFTTSLALPLEIVADVNAVQEAGTPTPQSPKAISGVSALNLFQRGNNIFNEDFEQGTYNTLTGNKANDPYRIRSIDYICVKPNTTYRFVTPTSILVYYYDADKTFISYDSGNSSRNLTTPNNCYYLTIAVGYSGYPLTPSTYGHDVSINYPSTDTTYHAYNPNSTEYTIQLGQTCYGGEVGIDGSGTQTKDRIDLGSLTWNNAAIDPSATTKRKVTSSAVITTGIPSGDMPDLLCEIYEPKTNNALYLGSVGIGISVSGYITITDTRFLGKTDAEVKEMLSGVYLVYPLATPTAFSVTPVEISALVGENNIFADSGDIEIKYKISLDEALVAKKIKFTPTGTVTSTNVQDAIEEVSQ